MEKGTQRRYENGTHQDCWLRLKPQCHPNAATTIDCFVGEGFPYGYPLGKSFFEFSTA